jgi:hypothetical protein
MKYLFTFSIIFCLALLTISCGSEAPEIREFRLKAATASAISVTTGRSTKPSSTMNVSFVGNCVTVASAKKMLNIVMVTTKGEVTLTDIHKRSGMFCSPNDGDITSVWISTEDKMVTKYNKLGLGASRSSIAQK